MMILRRLQSFFNPEQFQGWGRQHDYFEGWYFKVVAKDGTHAFAVIPGIAMDKDGHRHAFIQVLDGIKKTAVYHRFPAEAFLPTPGKFEIRVGENYFSLDKLELKLPGLSGSLQFSGQVPWPKPFYSPGIMGPYAFVPFMECYHGIMSMDHSVTGTVLLGSEPVNFDGGRGYAEKDWGHSFPSSYIWMQGNHFSKPGVSIKSSVAKIPWVRSSFVGFIAGLWIENKLYCFTTYNRTRLITCRADTHTVSLQMENRKYRLQLLAERDEATSLASPIRGMMEGRIEESMTARITVTLTDKKTNEVIFHDITQNAGLEIAGPVAELFTSP
mgnify:CR=1 FL=1